MGYVIEHEFKDSLYSFCISNADKNLINWLQTLSIDALERLKDQLFGVIAECCGYSDNQITDIHLLAFEIASINNNGRVVTLEPIKRMSIIQGLYSEVLSISGKRV